MEKSLLNCATSIADHSRQSSSASPHLKISADGGGTANQTNPRSGSKLRCIKSRYTEKKERALVNGKLQPRNNQLPFLEIAGSKHSVCLSPLTKRAHSRSLDDIHASKNMTVRVKDPKYGRIPSLSMGSSSQESATSSDQLRDSHIKFQIILQQTLLLLQKNLHVVVIKESYQESFIVCGIDILSDQRYELQITREDVESILGHKVHAASLEEEDMWVAILPRVKILPVLKFSNLEFEFERISLSTGGQSYDTYDKNHEMSPDSSNPYGDQAENACPNLPLRSSSSAASTVESSSSLLSHSSTSQDTIDQPQATNRRGILTGRVSPLHSSDHSIQLNVYYTGEEVQLKDTLQSYRRKEFEVEPYVEANNGCNGSMKSVSQKGRLSGREVRDEGQARSTHSLQLQQPLSKGAADTSSPPYTSDARDLKKKNFPTLPMNKRVKVKSVADAVTSTSTSSCIAGHHANPLRGILGTGPRQKENVKQGESTTKSDIISKSNSAPIPVPMMKQRSNPVKSTGCNAVLHQVKAVPVKPSQPIRKIECDNHHNSVSPKDILRDRSRLRLQVRVSPSPLKNQYQKSSYDVPLGSQKALLKLPATATATANKLSDRSRDKDRSKTDDKMKSRSSHRTQASTTPTVSTLSSNERIILNPPIISPRCPSAKDYDCDYETDGYTVDLEIFSENPGDKLPPLLTSYQPSVTATLELLKLRQGQNDEPCSSSRSVHRSCVDSSNASNSTHTQRDNEHEHDDDDDGKGHPLQGLQREAAAVVEAVVDVEAAETIVVAVDQDTLIDSASSHQKSENTDKTDNTDKSNEGEISEGAIDIDTISNESPDSDNFSYGSVGGWGNYVDEDVDVGDSNDFDDENEEISPSQLYGREGLFPATSRPYRVAGMKGIVQVQVPVTGSNQGGGHFRSGHGEHSEFSISANTTVCLNSVAIQKIVRNLDDGIEYRNIIPDGPRKND